MCPLKTDTSLWDAKVLKINLSLKNCESLHCIPETYINPLYLNLKKRKKKMNNRGKHTYSYLICIICKECHDYIFIPIDKNVQNIK